jgi:hypothetical protein
VVHGHGHVKESKALGLPAGVVRGKVHVVDQAVVLTCEPELAGVE